MSASATAVSDENPPWDAETRRLLVEWLSLPRERPAELLGGRIVEKRTATLVHGAAQGGVGAQLFPRQGRRSPAGDGWWLTQGV